MPGMAVIQRQAFHEPAATARSRADRFFRIGIVILLVTGSLAGCTVPYMQVDPQLTSRAQPMLVSGREGWLVKQQLRFGEFSSGPVRRSWTKGYNIPFIVRFSGAKEKLGYTVQNSAGESAEFFCLGKLREYDLPLFNKAFEVNLKTTDVFTCGIALGEQSYEFYSENLNQNPRFSEITGKLQTPGTEITIHPVGSLEGGQSSWSTTALGYQLKQDGRAVAAVETLNEGRVWISPELSADEQLLVAGVASALLLRSSLAEHNDDLL